MREVRCRAGVLVEGKVRHGAMSIVRGTVFVASFYWPAVVGVI